MKRLINTIALFLLGMTTVVAQDVLDDQDIPVSIDVIALEEVPGGTIIPVHGSVSSGEADESDNNEGLNLEGWQLAETIDTDANATEESSDNEVGPLSSSYSLLSVEGSRSLNLYPNPTKLLLNIDLPVEGNYELFIYDLAGKIQMHQYLENAFNYKLNVADLSEGFYLVRIYDGVEYRTVKITIAR